MARRSNDQHTAMNDMLSNIALGFIMLFIIAVIMMNPIAKRGDVPSKNEIIIIMEWGDESRDDVDLWVQHDNNIPVGFSNRNTGYLNLDRDDLGDSNDVVQIDGQNVILPINRETVNLRGITPGNYYVVAYMYNRKDNPALGPQQVRITVIDVNPYREVYSITHTMTRNREIVAFPAFTVDAEGNVTEIFNHTRTIVPTRQGPTQ